MPDMVKVAFNLSLYSRLLYPRHVVLATCVDNKGNPNIIPLSFSMPVSYNPPILVISVGLTKYSHKLITDTGEFVVNVPTVELADQTMLCGTVTGRVIDKFAESGLTPVPGTILKTPLIKECVAHIECKVRQSVVAGDHTLFIGDVVAATINEGMFDFDRQFPDIDKYEPLFAPVVKT